MRDLSPLEGLREALVQVIADQRREWNREREVMEAQARATIAELRADVVALTARVEEMVRERLSGLRDGRDGVDGKSVTVEDVAPMLAAEIDCRFIALPMPRDGQDASPEQIEHAVQVEVERRLSEIAERAAARIVVPEPVPGRDADPAEMRRLIDDAVARLPPAEPGKSVTLDDVLPVISEEVARRVAEIPLPLDGAPGPKGDPGERGEKGSSILLGSGAPPTTGRAGDVYLDLTTGNFHQFIS